MSTYTTRKPVRRRTPTDLEPPSKGMWPRVSTWPPTNDPPNADGTSSSRAHNGEAAQSVGRRGERCDSEAGAQNLCPPSPRMSGVHRRPERGAVGGLPTAFARVAEC